MYVCVCVCSRTGLEGGALCCHAPRAGAAAFGHHDGELVQRVGLQTRHHVVQAGSVGHLGTHTGAGNHAHTITKQGHYFWHTQALYGGIS